MSMEHIWVWIWNYVIGSNELNVRSETFVQPEVGPPVHCDQIAKPLMGQFVSDDYSHALPNNQIKNSFSENKSKLTSILIEVLW